MSLIKCVLISMVLYGCPLSEEPRLIDLREGFRQAVVANEVENFFDSVKDLEQLAAPKQAYQACAYAMKAKESWNPFSKLAYIRKYDQLMEKATDQSPNNIEIRFLRFSIEYNLPEWLGMSDHISEDIHYISNHTADIEQLMLHSEYAQYILYFIRETGLCESSTITELQQALIKE